MIVGTFAPYTKDQQKASEQDLDSEPTSAAVFNLLTLPFFSFTGERGPRIGADKDRPRKLKQIKKAFRPLILQELGADRISRRLCYEGGEIVLEQEEFRIVKAVWEELRATLDTSFAEVAVAVDDWIDNVAEYTATEWKAELERRVAVKTVPAGASPTEPVAT